MDQDERYGLFELLRDLEETPRRVQIVLRNGFEPRLPWLRDASEAGVYLTDHPDHMGREVMWVPLSAIAGVHYKLSDPGA